MTSGFRDNHYRLAEIDGKVIYYDAMSSDRNAYDPNKFRHIGQGKIHSIDGHLWGEGTSGYGTGHFFVRIERGATHGRFEEEKKPNISEAQKRIGVGQRGFSYR